jgi:hypothetical protein
VVRKGRVVLVFIIKAVALLQARVFVLILLVGRTLWPPVVLMKKQLVCANGYYGGDDGDDYKEKHCFELLRALFLPRNMKSKRLRRIITGCACAASSR